MSGQEFDGVIPATGQFNTFINIANLIGNGGMGPALNLNLYHTSGYYDRMFYNWGLKLNHAVYVQPDPNSHNIFDRTGYGELFLTTGESWKYEYNKPLSTPNLTTSFVNSQLVISHKSGNIEYLTPFTIYSDHTNYFKYYLPTKIISVAGRTLTLTWTIYDENQTNTLLKGFNTPQLTSILDDTQILLRADYARSAAQTIVTFHVWPDTEKYYNYSFEIGSSGLAKASLSNPASTRVFENIDIGEKWQFILSPTNITNSSGQTTNIKYNAQKKVSNLTTTDNHSSSKISLDYQYHIQANIQTTTINSSSGEIKTLFFDKNNVQTKETIKNGNSVKTVETFKTLIKGNKDFSGQPSATNQPDGLEITTKTTYQNANQQTRTEVTKVVLDTLGNIIYKMENNVFTEWTYYRGMPKEETLVTVEKFTDASGISGVLGWIGDNLHPIGWGFQLFGNAGLSWGTQEKRTVVNSRYLTNTGKRDYNLPIDIICPGNPYYFKVYLESERTFVIRDGKKVYLKCIYYGYGDLPVRGNTVKGPAVVPTRKLTVYNPAADLKGKLNAWTDGTMILEDTDYITDVASVNHGRILSTSQCILDAKGNKVAGSQINTRFDYKLSGSTLETTTTTTPEGVPAFYEIQTIDTINGALLSNTNTYGKTITYAYDTLGRLTGQQSPYSNTTIIHKDYQAKGNSAQRISPAGEQSFRNFDALGRLTQTFQLKPDGTAWLSMDTTQYDAQGRKASTTEHDYRPDGSVLISRTQKFSYNDWGDLSKIEWEGGETQHYDYDPVSQQTSQSVTYGPRSIGSTSVLISEDAGASRLETYSYANNQLITSHTTRYNAFGQVVQESSSDAPIINYLYDSFGRPTNISAAGTSTINEYPAHILNNVASRAYLESNNQRILLGSRQIDSLARVTQSTLGGHLTNFSYEANSPWAKNNNPRNDESQQTIPITVSAAFDPAANRTTETTTGGVARNSETTTSTYQHTYSIRGLLLSETDAFGNTTNINYDNQGNVVSTSSNTVNISYVYNAGGQLAKETLTCLNNNRAVVTQYEYDSLGREVKRTFDISGFKSLALTTNFHASNKIAQMALYENDVLLRVEQFDYDTMGRLKTYRCDGSLKPSTAEGLVVDSQTFSYDLVGNIKQCDSVSEGRLFSTVFQYDGTDPTQLVSVNHLGLGSTRTFNYDNQGFLADTDGHKLTYNKLGKLSSRRSSQESYRYLYNNLGDIAGCDGTNYYEQYYYKRSSQYARKGMIDIYGQLYNRTCILLNDSHSCLLQENTYAAAGYLSTRHSFEIKDIKGTVIASFDTWNNSSTFFSYTPFGYRPVDPRHHSWIGFNGEPFDRTNGTYYLGNGVRVYDPRTQNFQSPDTLSPFGEGGPNARSYCHNDPVNYSDPSGHAEIVNQYTVVTHNPAMRDPVVQAIVYGGIGVALAPFTGGASVGWTVAATGLAIASAGFGIASAALEKNDPDLASIFGWASLGTGLASGAVGIMGGVVAARAAQAGAGAGRRLGTADTHFMQRIVQGAESRGGGLAAGSSINGNVTTVLEGKPFTSTYELYSGGPNSRTLYIDSHGTAMQKEYVLTPLPTTEIQFRSPIGVKAADVNTTWQQRLTDNTPYRYAPGTTNIPNYILSEFTISQHITVGSLPASSAGNHQVVFELMAKISGTDILRPTSEIIFDDLLTTLKTDGFTYDRIIGNFCRGPMPYNTPKWLAKTRVALGLY